VPIGDLNREFEQFVCLERLSGNALLERFALPILHHDKGLALVLPNVVNRADVRVIQRGGSLRFTLEPFQGLPVLGEFFREEFQGDGALELGVLGLVHHAHAAPAELLQNAVVRDGLADHRVPLCERSGSQLRVKAS